MKIKLMYGDCLERMKEIPDNSIDSIVTDPPYGLGKEPNPKDVMESWIKQGFHEIRGKGFMGKQWDSFVPQPIIWKEVFRILKPGAHLLVFSGTRTYDWMTMALRFSGFEIRDQLQWLYGSGFPKSHNISKAIDKEKGKKRGKGKLIRTDPNIKSNNYKNSEGKGRISIYEEIPGCDESTFWDGWGTALKPANEPIVLARKPLGERTVAKNILKWGTGGINIADCRIVNRDKNDSQKRFPSNVLLDKEAAKELDSQSGILKSGGFKKDQKSKESKNTCMSGKNYARVLNERKPTIGGASRFFYCAKASKKERNEGLEGREVHRFGAGIGEGKNPEAPTIDKNFHPTVKPLSLMAWMVKLITPPNGKVMDPFMGSGSTGIAAKKNRFSFIGIEKDKEYFKIARERIRNTNPSNLK